MRYSIVWKNYDETQCCIEITPFGIDDDSDPINLTPSANPLATEEDDDDDVMIPVRSTTAKIGVVCTNDAMIKIERDNQWRVTARRGNEIVFRGFLKSEVLDMSYSAEHEEIVYTAIDDLEAAKCWRTDTTPRAVSLIGMIREYVEKISCSDGTYINISDAIFRIPNDDQGIGILSATVNNNAWITRERSSNLLTGSTYYDVLEDISRAAGLSWRSYGNSLYLYSPFSASGSRYYINTGVFRKTGNWHQTGDIPPEWYGKHRYSLIPAKGKVVVTSKCAGDSEDAAKLDVEHLKMIGTSWKRQRVDGYDNDHSIMSIVAKVYDKIGSNIEVTQTGLQALETVAVSDNTGGFQKSGSFVISEDYWDTPSSMEDRGTLPEDNVKKTFQFEDVLYMVQTKHDDSIIVFDNTATSSFDDALAAMYAWARSRNLKASIRYTANGLTDGGLSIALTSYVSKSAWKAGGNFTPIKYPPFEDRFVPIEQMARFGVVLTAKLGNYYLHPEKVPSAMPQPWFADFEFDKETDGNTWCSSLDLESSGNFTDYNVDSFTLDIKKIADKIGPLYGEIEITCWGAYVASESNYTVSVGKIGITKWEVKHEAVLSELIKETELSVSHTVNSMVEDEEEVETKLTADADVRRHAGSLRLGNGTHIHVIETTDYAGNETIGKGSLRETLLWRYLSAHAESRKIYTIEARNMYGTTPESALQVNGGVHTVMAVSADYKSGKKTIKTYPATEPSVIKANTELVRIDLYDEPNRLRAVVGNNNAVDDFDLAIVKKSENGIIAFAWRFDGLGHYMTDEINYDPEEFTAPEPSDMFIVTPSEVPGVTFQCFIEGIPLAKG